MDRSHLAGRVAFAGAAVEVVLALVMALAGNAEGWLGGLLFAAMYAVPLLLVGTGLRLHGRAPAVAACVGVLLALGYGAVVLGNWDGYSGAQANAAVFATAPAVLAYLTIFWLVVIQRHPEGGRRATR